MDAVEYNEDGGVDSPLFVGDGGVRAFVIPGSSTPIADLPGGLSAESLAPELANQTLSHEGVGVVSLVVERGAPPPPPKERLVSVNGKFQTVADPPAPGPNGTAFTITVAPGAARRFWTARTSSWGRCWRDGGGGRARRVADGEG